MTTSLTCPKCGSAMRSYERNRVLVGQAPYRTYSNAPRYATSKGYYGHRRRRSFLSELFDD